MIAFVFDCCTSRDFTCWHCRTTRHKTARSGHAPITATRNAGHVKPSNTIPLRQTKRQHTGLNLKTCAKTRIY
eukprot:370005-Amphidinium_carterae.1